MDLATDRFTVGVFKDIPSAEKGIEALVRQNFPVSSLSAIAGASPEAETFLARVFGSAPTRGQVKHVGDTLLHGPLIDVLNAGEQALASEGLAAAARHAGFQSHDGVIFERLVVRGGVLVAVSSEGRASDALATLHAYGGGNAAIGAWTGRV